MAGQLGMTQTLGSDYALLFYVKHHPEQRLPKVLPILATERSAPAPTAQACGPLEEGRLQKIEKLSKRQKQALLVTLDHFLKGAGVS